MKNNSTGLRQLKAGRPKTVANDSSRKSFSTGASTNYKMMLEIYCINKKEASGKKDLKYQRIGVGKRSSSGVKPSFSIATVIISFFEESLLLLKKLKPRIAVTAVSE